MRRYVAAMVVFVVAMLVAMQAMVSMVVTEPPVEKEEVLPTTPAPPTPVPPTNSPTKPPPLTLPPRKTGRPKAPSTGSKVVAHIDIPFTGPWHLRCSLGDLRAVVDRGSARVAAQDNEVSLTVLKAWGKVPGKKLHPVVTAMLRDPVERTVEAFNRAVSTQQLHHFKCQPPMDRKLLEADFSIEKYAVLPEVVRRLCEETRNVQVKALSGLPPHVPAEPADLDRAKHVVLKRLDVLMLAEDIEKSFHFLSAALGGSRTPFKASYFRCAPPYATFDEPSPRAMDVLREENALDIQLLSAARHHFFTKWAGRHEETFVAPGCANKPHMCWEADYTTKRPKTVPFEGVGELAHPICATRCISNPSS